MKVSTSKTPNSITTGRTNRNKNEDEDWLKSEVIF
jgi:hypothetical protein